MTPALRNCGCLRTKRGRPLGDRVACVLPGFGRGWLGILVYLWRFLTRVTWSRMDACHPMFPPLHKLVVTSNKPHLRCPYSRLTGYTLRLSPAVGHRCKPAVGGFYASMQIPAGRDEIHKERTTLLRHSLIDLRRPMSLGAD